MLEDALKRRYKDAQEVMKDLLPNTPAVKTMVINPGVTAESYFNSGNNYLNLKEYKKAIADYTQAIQLNPHDADFYYNRGLAYYKLKEYEKAEADYNQATQLKS